MGNPDLAVSSVTVGQKTANFQFRTAPELAPNWARLGAFLKRRFAVPLSGCAGRALCVSGLANRKTAFLQFEAKVFPLADSLLFS
jgi:hypothetical protein